MVEFGERLKKLRKEKRLTQKQLAAMIGVQHSIISFYEVGDRIPSAEIIIKLSSVLHVSSDYLLGIEKREVIDISGLNAEDKGLIRAMVNIIREKAEYKNRTSYD